MQGFTPENTGQLWFRKKVITVGLGKALSFSTYFISAEVISQLISTNPTTTLASTASSFTNNQIPISEHSPKPYHVEPRAAKDHR